MAAPAIGLTGGIASGKSSVAARFAALGVDVVDADAVAREVVAPGTPGLGELVGAFGPGILDADGALDRRRMRERVFDDAQARRRLEAIVHPRVRRGMHEALERARGPYAVAAVPLLAEGGGRAAYPWMQRILVVDVPAALQLERVTRRDGIDAALAARMIAAQATRMQRLAIADDVLVNDASLSELAAQVDALDRRYRRLAREAQAGPARG